MRTALAGLIWLGGALASPAHETGIAWLDLNEGLARAKATRTPIAVWIAPPVWTGCADYGVCDGEVAAMLADFVPVRIDDRPAAHGVLILDHNGTALPDLAVRPDEAGNLPADKIIDLLSSGLDVVR